MHLLKGHVAEYGECSEFYYLCNMICGLEVGVNMTLYF